MGSACDICEQQTGEMGYTPYAQRSYVRDANKDPSMKMTS